MKFFSVLLMMFLLQSAYAENSADIGFITVRDAYVAILKEPNIQRSINQGWLVIAVPAGSHAGVWWFSPEKDPAYPSVVKRIPIEKDGHLFIDMRVLCGATKVNCDRLVDEFRKSNEKIAQEKQVKTETK